jgi:recombinational DNA repair protein (RecF pathway)
MSYVTYTTDAIVCGTQNRNTADRSYLLFTREAGMLFATARSAREERSRQRYSLQDFSLVRVSLVKGKTGWRVGSISSQKNFYNEATDKYARGSVVSIYRLLRRFLSGEEANAELFDYVIAVLNQLVSDTPDRHFVELVTQLHILGFLGYVDIKKIPHPLYEIAPDAIAEQYSQSRLHEVTRLHNQAITTSHL